MNIENLLLKYSPINTAEKVDLLLSEIIHDNPSLLHFNTRVRIICEIRSIKIQLLFIEKWNEAIINDTRRLILTNNVNLAKTLTTPKPEVKLVTVSTKTPKKKDKGKKVKVSVTNVKKQKENRNRNRKPYIRSSAPFKLVNNYPDPDSLKAKAEEIRKQKYSAPAGTIPKPSAPLKNFISENEEDPIHRK